MFTSKVLTFDPNVYPTIPANAVIQISVNSDYVFGISNKVLVITVAYAETANYKGGSETIKIDIHNCNCEEEIQELTDCYNQLLGYIQTNQTNIGKINETLADIAEILDTLADKDIDITGWIDTLTQRIDDLTIKVTSNTANITANTTDINALKDTVAKLGNKDTELQNSINKLQSELNALADRVTAAENDIIKLKADLAAKYSELNGLISNNQRQHPER
jgi:chromosome segregation ATPase